ncbi:MAG: putative transposase [Candidatus Berkelbacteria bacterium Licking1014_85]|uniref:Putative transposase n=1 Tax=Candidatus Berkelbacteria bacterium Licking1014_85 TaxID=2017148 RepID=A0A554LHR8_9BACT|nr:MAG: putative transposase [Candidatus Berkelbacteria bacterium Licking1014_85]
MPRPPRLLLSKSYYHIMTRGNNKNIVFRKEADFQYYLYLISRYKPEHLFDLYHYCLMPNHVHLLIRTKNALSFSIFMKKINLAYVHYYKNHYGWIGHFWQGRYKSQPVGKDEYFIQCGKYIELNAVRAELAEKPEDYKFSSYCYYAYGESNKLITKDMFYDELGKNDTERQLTYRDLIVSEFIPKKKVEKIWADKSQTHNEKQKIKYNLKNR